MVKGQQILFPLIQKVPWSDRRRPLFPKIFNVVVDAVIHHWVMMMAANEEVREGIELSIRYLVSYYYAKNVLVAFPQQDRLQRVLNILKGFFGRVDLRTNTQNTVIMACQPYHTPGRMLVGAYESRTTGAGPTFWERQRRRV